jgi:NADPH-dependent ferric siderophore reductase
VVAFVDAMSADKTLFDLVRHPLRVRLLEVVRTEFLGPRMRRITLGGPELEGFVSLAPEDHVKLFFPRPGESKPIVPSFGPMGLVLPKLGPKPAGRDYTPLRFDPIAQELDIDFFLHGAGLGSSWASRAVLGDVLGVAGPRGSYVLKRDFSWQLFVGDETAVPEMAFRIAQLPETSAAIGVFLVDDADNELRSLLRPNVDVRWVHRNSTNDAAAALVSAVRAIELPNRDGFAWLAGETSEVRAVYRHLLGDPTLVASHIRVSGHWKRGVVAHDHHEPIVVE